MFTNDNQPPGIMLSIVDITFTEWLNLRMKERGWTQSDLARAAGLSRGAVSHVLNGSRKPGNDFCESVARALKMPPETVFRAAGLLPERPAEDPLTQEAEYLLSQLPEEKKQQAINFIRFLAGETEFRGETPLASRRVERPGHPSP